MKTLDEKLAALASIQGSDPLVRDEYGHYTIECSGVSCSKCPFHTTQCTAFADFGKVTLVAIKVRTYKDAIALYPEAFL